MKPLRRLKVYSKFRTRTRDNIMVPEIRLEGKWLEDIGFKTGQEVNIEQTQDRITITPRQSESKE